MQLSQQAVSIIDWVVLGLSGILFLACTAGGLYVASYGGSTSRHTGAGFNYLWQSRLCFQIASAAYALGQLLRLQVLWGPESAFGEPKANPSAMCRAYLAVEYGLLEPATLLLSLFTCFYSIKSKLAPPVTGGVAWALSEPGLGTEHAPAMTPRPGIAHPNSNIVFFAIGFTLPCITAQLLCALFSRIFGDHSDLSVFRFMFSAYDDRQTGYCPTERDPSRCVWCVFPLLSTLVSAALVLCYLLALWVVTTRIITSAINKLLIRRVRVLQALVTLSLLSSVTCRGVTVLFVPFDLGFELLRLGHVLLSTTALLALSYLLVWRPVRDARLAERHVRELQRMGLHSDFALVALNSYGQSRSTSANGTTPGGAPATSLNGGTGTKGGGTFWQTNAAIAAAAAAAATTPAPPPHSADGTTGSTGGGGALAAAEVREVRVGIRPDSSPGTLKGRSSLQLPMISNQIGGTAVGSTGPARVLRSASGSGLDASSLPHRISNRPSSLLQHDSSGTSYAVGVGAAFGSGLDSEGPSGSVEPEKQPLVADAR